MAKTRGIETLRIAESIKGATIGEADLEFLEGFSRKNRVFGIEVGTATTFSKPMQFFRSQSTKFQYLVDGKLIPFSELNGNTFIAFQLRNGVLRAFGFFPGEY